MTTCVRISWSRRAICNATSVRRPLRLRKRGFILAKLTLKPSLLALQRGQFRRRDQLLGFQIGKACELIGDQLDLTRLGLDLCSDAVSFLRQLRSSFVELRQLASFDSRRDANRLCSPLIISATSGSSDLRARE